MPFYQSIAPHYEQIFPLSAAQVAFTKHIAVQNHYQTLLDIGCAIGDFAAAMADTVSRVEGFDLDEGLLAQAQQRLAKLDAADRIRFQVGNMLHLDVLYPDTRFDLITCFGNTLVHLQAPQVAHTLKQVRAHLAPGGMFVCQILNYDFIYETHLTALPLIDNDAIRFERFYHLDTPGEVGFETILTVKASGEVIHNRITLYPLHKQAFVDLLTAAGFGQIDLYRNYQGEPYSGDHLPLILTARV